MININGGVNNFGHATYNGPVAAGDVHAEAGKPAAPVSTADVGVLTILDEEIRAVQGELQRMRDYRERRLGYGPLAREAWVPAVRGGRVRVAAVQTFTRGTESAAMAYQGLVAEYHPRIVLLVGIAGGIAKDIRIGDVVVSDEIIAYDARREARDGVHRRGQAQAVAAPLGHRLNDFFAALPPLQFGPAGESFRVFRGPIGSGNAVVTDYRSEIRRWLTVVNEKVLAVETEAAGVAQGFHETAGESGALGWLTVRGISDTADKRKGHSFHELASQHAAAVMAALLPFLLMGDG
jgi:adenosylhomocysteine nucleosidase